MQVGETVHGQYRGKYYVIVCRDYKLFKATVYDETRDGNFETQSAVKDSKEAAWDWVLSVIPE